MGAAALALALAAWSVNPAAHAGQPNRLEVAFYDGGSAVSSDISRLPFWSDLVRREAPRPDVAASKDWAHDPRALLKRINKEIDAAPFVPDDVNWRAADYWETPEELRVRGGDCEDFAAAKYFSLRAAGVPAHAMQIVVVFDEDANVRHAVLLVQLPDDVVALDNRHGDIMPIGSLGNYRPILAMNELEWRLASAELRQSRFPS